MKSASQRRALVAAFLAAALAGCSHNCFNRGEGCSSSSATAVTDTSTTAGQVVDGYVANATITLDVNDNRLCGDTVNGVVDISVQADAQGNFTFPAGTGSHMICATGGTDLSTGLPLVGRLLAPPGATEITPLTSLVMAQLNISQPSGKLTAATVSSAQTSLATSLGLGSINLLTADPVALANATPANPALLQTTAAIQAMLVQTASTLQAIGGNGTAVQGSANTNYLYSDAVKGVVSAIKSLPAGTTLSATGSGASSLGSLALVAVTNAATLAQNDNRLSGVSLGSMSPSSIAAFVAPSLTAMTNIVGSATSNTLLTAGSNNPAANVQANVTVANTAALLAPTILTKAAAGNATLVADLATLAADALPPPSATGVVTPPASEAALLTAIQNTGVNTANLPSAATLAAARGLNNVTNVVEADINCDLSGGVPQVSCGTPARMVFNANNPLNQATSTIHGNWNSVVLRLANPTGVALGDPATSPGATLSGRLRITVLPTNTADQRYLNLDVPVTGVQMTDAGGTHIVAAVAGSVVVSGITRTGTVETAVISQAESARIILLPQTGNAIGLNLQELVSALGGNPALSAGSFSTLFSLNGGSAGQNTDGVGQSFTITVSTSSADSANAPLNFLHLTTFPNPAPAVTNTFIMTVTFARAGPFAYVTSVGDNTVSAYSINAATGALKALGSPVTTGANPQSVAVSPNGQFAYVANADDGTVSAYSINASTGALTAIAGSPYPTGSSPTSVVVSPDGQFAYVTNPGDNNFLVYSINGNTGALTEVSGSPFAANVIPFTLALAPNGQFAFAGNNFDSSVSVYGINVSTGALTGVPGSPFAAGDGPSYVAVSPNSHFVYVTNLVGNSVSAYTVNASTGVLSAVIGSPLNVGNSPFAVVVSPNGQFAYVTNSGDGTVSAYSINASTGALTAVNGSPFTAGNQPLGVVVSPNGQFAYVTNNGDGTVSAYSINASTGALTALPGSPFKTGTTGTGAFSIAISP